MSHSHWLGSSSMTGCSAPDAQTHRTKCLTQNNVHLTSHNCQVSNMQCNKHTRHHRTTIRVHIKLLVSKEVTRKINLSEQWCHFSRQNKEGSHRKQCLKRQLQKTHSDGTGAIWNAAINHSRRELRNWKKLVANCQRMHTADNQWQWWGKT